MMAAQALVQIGLPLTVAMLSFGVLAYTARMAKKISR